MAIKKVVAGDAVLIHGEVLEVLASGEIEEVGALITDPPYSSGGHFRDDRMGTVRAKYQGGDVKKSYPSFSGDNRDQRGYLAWCALWMGGLAALAPEGTPIGVFSDWRQAPLVTDAIQVGGWIYRGLAVWDKGSSSRPQGGRFRAQCEYLLWGSKGRMPNRGKALPGVFRAPPVPGHGRAHLAQKPEAVMAEIVRIAPPGSVIVDPFMGSGTTALAALRSGRRFVGVEMSPEYFEIAVERVRGG